MVTNLIGQAAAIAPWFCLRLPSYGPGLNPMRTVYAFSNVYHRNCDWNEKRTKISKKDVGIGPYLKNRA